MKRYELGLILIALGAVLLLNVFGIFELPSWEQFWSYWPLLLAAAGLLFLLRGNTGFLSFFLLFLGAFFSLRRFAVYPFAKEEMVWPAVLICSGFSFVLSAAFAGRRTRVSAGGRETGKSEGKPPKGTRASDILDENIVLAGKDFAVVSGDFRGGELSVFLGGMEVDLRGVRLQQPALLYLRCTLGGLEIFLPPDVPVRITGQEILGGADIDVPSDQSAAQGPVLTIDYQVTLGGIEIRR